MLRLAACCGTGTCCAGCDRTVHYSGGVRADRKCHLCTIPAEHPRKRRSDGCTAAIAGNGKEAGERCQRHSERHYISSLANDHAAAGAAEAAEEKDEFDVELAEVGPNKVKVIKVVREVTGLGLKEAKEMVDGAPKVVKEGASKAEAEDIKTKLEAEGAKVTLK